MGKFLISLVDHNEEPLYRSGNELRRRCPVCKSEDVRRSSFYRTDVTWFGALSPYRCRNCDAHFTVISQNFYLLVVVGLVAAAIAILITVGIFVGTGLDSFMLPQNEK